MERKLITLTAMTRHGAVSVARLYRDYWGCEVVEGPRPGAKFPWEVVLTHPFPND